MASGSAARTRRVRKHDADHARRRQEDLALRAREELGGAAAHASRGQPAGPPRDGVGAARVDDDGPDPSAAAAQGGARQGDGSRRESVPS